MARSDTTRRRQKPLRLPHTNRFTEKPFRRYTSIIGQANLAWNDLQIKLGHIFGYICSLSFPNSKEKNYLHLKSHYIWYSSQSDRASRAMLKAVLQGMSLDERSKYPKFIGDVEWLLTETTKLEDMRNNVVHAPLLLITKSELVPEVHNMVLPKAQTPRGVKLLGKDLLKEYRWCRDAAIVLRDYAEAIQLILYWQSLGALPPDAWPRRPSLPNRGQRKSKHIVGKARSAVPTSEVRHHRPRGLRFAQPTLRPQEFSP